MPDQDQAGVLVTLNIVHSRRSVLGAGSSYSFNGTKPFQKYVGIAVTVI